MKQRRLTLREHTSEFFGRVRVPHLFRFLCCPITCPSVVSSVLWCPIRFPQQQQNLCLYLKLSCLIYVICVCLRKVVSNTYCVVFLFCFSSSCVPYVVSFSELSMFDCPFGILVYLQTKIR